MWIESKGTPDEQLVNLASACSIALQQKEGDWCLLATFAGGTVVTVFRAKGRTDAAKQEAETLLKRIKTQLANQVLVFKDSPESIA
jgi:hypothetical protein